jgi:spore maturation protein CgeB
MLPSCGKSMLLVGNPGVVHVGTHLLQAVKTLNLQVVFADATKAFAGPLWSVKFHWWLRGHHPPLLRRFSQHVIQFCQEFQPSCLLSTGIAPIERSALEAIGNLGIQRLNYLTDDPWNPAHWAPWFMKALPCYDQIFFPRRANLEDLQRLGCPKVAYLPFAYAPEIHFREPPATPSEEACLSSDVVFAGGADRDRVPLMAALARAGFRVRLYGGYWERFPETRPYTHGNADPHTLRKVIAAAKVALCLVRRANRDGHVMRTFEVPAMGGCMLTEDTEEHREIFGEEGKAVVYFRIVDEMIQKLNWLLDHDDERRRLADTAHTLITEGSNSYKDRLVSMLDLTRSQASGLNVPTI